MGDLDALRRGLCTDEQEEKCRAEFGKHLEWSCQNCAKIRRADLHPYTAKLLRMVALQDAGYPLGANDLGLEEWFDLARVKQTIKPPLNCPLLVKKKK